VIDKLKIVKIHEKLKFKMETGLGLRLNQNPQTAEVNIQTFAEGVPEMVPTVVGSLGVIFSFDILGLGMEIPKSPKKSQKVPTDYLPIY
jgi:hypothetical protein